MSADFSPNPKKWLMIGAAGLAVSLIGFFQSGTADKINFIHINEMAQSGFERCRHLSKISLTE
jgi:hypothetical protein